MIRSLLLLFLGLAAMSAVTEPLHAQYIFLDTNHDGVCDSQDILTTSGVDTVDVWIDTSRNQDGSAAVCSTGEDLTISSYELIFQCGQGTAILSWANARPEFPIEEHKTLQIGTSWVGYTSSGGTTHLAPGKYLLGKGAYQWVNTMTCPYIGVAAQSAAFPSAETKFYSQCLGSQADNFIRLGTDFYDVCGAYIICDDAQSTTWGHIKELYR